MRAVCCYANVGGLDAVAVGAVAVSTWVDCDAAGNVVKVLCSLYAGAACVVDV